MPKAMMSGVSRGNGKGPAQEITLNHESQNEHEGYGDDEPYYGIEAQVREKGISDIARQDNEGPRWARLISLITPKISDRPRAMRAYSPPSMMPMTMGVMMSPDPHVTSHSSMPKYAFFTSLLLRSSAAVPVRATRPVSSM